MAVYQATDSFPKNELYGLTSQARRAAFSVVANIAEGSAKKGAREFRRYYHCTLGEYLRQLRIETACGELSNSEEPLSVIAANAGFYDQSHFSNTFRRYTGMTPTQYRSLRQVPQGR